MQNVESVSTLMDGELDADEAAREITHFRQDDARCNAWNTYHAIGDVMRGEQSRVGLSANFSRQLSERLALEPTVIGPRLRMPKTAQNWTLLAAASVAAVAVVGMALNTLNPESASEKLATAPAAKLQVLQPDGPILRAPPLVAIAPEHIHEYLLAHQGVSPSTAIQGVTPYIRTVSNVGNEAGLR